jgi:hypothetical protein
MACPNCGAQGGGPTGCTSCGLGRDPKVGRHINTGPRPNSSQRPSKRDCFPGDARVLTPAGYRRLDSVRKGDAVISWNSSGRLVAATVLRSVRHHAHALLRVESESPELSFWATKRHPVASSRGWTRVRDLRPGDVLQHIGADGRPSQHRVQAVVPSDRVEAVFNIIVDGNHTFIVHGCVAHSFVYLRGLRCAIHAGARCLGVILPKTAGGASQRIAGLPT